MKLFFLLCTIFVFLSGKLQAIYIDDYYFPDDKITLIEENFYNDLIDGSLQRFNSFDAFLVASGIVLSEEIQFYRDRFHNIEQSLKNRIESSNNNISKGKIILKWLHENIFRQYKQDTRGIYDLVNRGESDCLSSSIIYYILAEKFGLMVRFIKVPEHVFCQIYRPQRSQWINVETTSPFGYNPGEVEITKMEKVTVKKWLPRTEYSKQEITSFFPLLSYVILERNSLEMEKTNISEVIYTSEHLYIFKKAIFFDPHSTLLKHNIKALLIKFGNQYLECGQYNRALIFINEGLRKYQDQYIFQQLHVNYYLNKAREAYSEGDYQKAVLVLDEGLQKYPNFENIAQNLTAYITAWGNEFFQNLNYSKALEIYKYGLNKPINHSTLENNIKSCYYNLANEKFRAYEMDEALIICKEALSLYSNEYNLKELYKTILYNSSIIHLNSDNLSKAMDYCNRGRRSFPKDKGWDELEEKINRAYKIFYYNSALYEYKNTKNYQSAYEYCIKGLEVETRSKDLDRDLQELKKKCEFWL